ncbi:MAG: DUF1772 domain-containing protein [Dichotomicrobium sp.]
MPDEWRAVLVIVAGLGSGLMAGLYFAFSVAVMGALARLPAADGTAAMQSINTVILNPLFLGVFFGTGVICVVLGLAALADPGAPGALTLLAACLLYLVGNIAVTIVANVPLNNALAGADPDSAEGGRVWSRYLTVWTRWNHVRAVACLAATALFMAWLHVR